MKLSVFLALGMFLSAFNVYAAETPSASEPTVWDKTKDVSTDVWNGTKTVASDVWDGTKDVASDVWSGTKEVGSDIKNGLSDDTEDKSSKTKSK